MALNFSTAMPSKGNDADSAATAGLSRRRRQVFTQISSKGSNSRARAAVTTSTTRQNPGAPADQRAAGTTASRSPATPGRRHPPRRPGQRRSRRPRTGTTAACTRRSAAESPAPATACRSQPPEHWRHRGAIRSGRKTRADHPRGPRRTPECRRHGGTMRSG